MDEWWAISGVELRAALQRVAEGGDPDLVYAELYANSVIEESFRVLKDDDDGDTQTP